METKKSSPQRIRLRFREFLIFSIIAITILILHSQSASVAEQLSYYATHHQQKFNQPQYYPIQQNIDSRLYRPIDNWVGRLILPTAQQEAASDWVWLEIQIAPPTAQNLVGKIIPLKWQKSISVNQRIVTLLEKDIHFSKTTRNSIKQGNIHPTRLDGRKQVGPLQSLAGARPNDDVIVAFPQGNLVKTNDGDAYLEIDQEPVIVTGRFWGLVEILHPVICPGISPCPPGLFLVRHYNPTSGNFNGVEETIHIPEQIADQRKFPPSTSRQIEISPAGEAGWYIYGAKDSQGVFTVQSIAPRSLFQLQPEQRIVGKKASLDYIQFQNWQISAADKGKIRKVSLENQSLPWKLGDRAIVLHNFGGIGGKNGEGSQAYTITGHFAFGLAEVVRDSFSQELQFSIQYQQIYAHNSNGIIAGKHSWADYMGNLQWGWAATRPVSDVLVKFPPITQDYNFDGMKLSPLGEFRRQLEMMMARYRVGNGTGGAVVSPATSCVQDSSQALYLTIQTIKQQISEHPTIQKWLNSHAHDPQTLRFQQLAAFGSSLEQELAPLGIVRKDWRKNASSITGIGDGREMSADSSIWAGIMSWRTMLPRAAHDQLATLFLNQGGQLWLLETNQIGGWNPDILPVAPTVLFGQITIPFTNIAPIPLGLSRVLTSLTIPKIQDGLIVVGMLLIYSGISLPLGLATGFLHLTVNTLGWRQQLSIALQAVIFPALSEELCFRVLFLPHPSEAVPWQQWILPAIFMLFLFILYHPLNAKTLFKAGFPTFFQPIFLILAGLLGLVCTVTYQLTGSLWAIAFIHWIVVVVWLLKLGGIEKLPSRNESQIRNSL